MGIAPPPLKGWGTRAEIATPPLKGWGTPLDLIALTAPIPMAVAGADGRG
jgi:hypothetical protein